MFCKPSLGFQPVGLTGKLLSLPAATPTTLIQERANLQLEVKRHLGVERREGATSLWGTRQMVTLQQHFSR